MVLSILHRATGIALGVGTLLLTWWIIALSSGRESYQSFQGFIIHPVGRLILFGFTFALIFHALNGVRHLFWDAGKGFAVFEVKPRLHEGMRIQGILTRFLDPDINDAHSYLMRAAANSG